VIWDTFKDLRHGDYDSSLWVLKERFSEPRRTHSARAAQFFLSQGPALAIVAPIATVRCVIPG
jgi:hypothetical protein